MAYQKLDDYQIRPKKINKLVKENAEDLDQRRNTDGSADKRNKLK